MYMYAFEMFVVTVIFRNMRQISNTCSWTEHEWNKKKREKLLLQKLSNTRRYETGTCQNKEMISITTCQCFLIEMINSPLQEKTIHLCGKKSFYESPFYSKLLHLFDCSKWMTKKPFSKIFVTFLF